MSVNQSLVNAKVIVKHTADAESRLEGPAAETAAYRRDASERPGGCLHFGNQEPSSSIPPQGINYDLAQEFDHRIIEQRRDHGIEELLVRGVDL